MSTKSSLSADEITLTLTNTINGLQLQLETQRKEYNEKIKKLEETLKEKEVEIDDLKDELATSQKNKEDKKIIEKFRIEKDMINEELSKKIEELSKAIMDNSNLQNQIELQKQNMMQLELDKTNLNKKIEEEKEEYKNLQNKYYFIQKKLDMQDEENKKVQEKFDEKDKIIDDLNKQIQELNDKIKKSEESSNNLLRFVKDLKEKEEQLKKEKEELNKEKEKFNLLMQELENKKKEEKKKTKIDLIKEEVKPEKEEQIKDKNILEQENTIIDLLCEFLLKLNNLQYYMSLFDLIEESLKRFDELKYVYLMNLSSHESMNDILFDFFELFKSYISVSQKSATLNDFLLQNNFRLTKLSKDEKEIIKKINSLKFSQDTNTILEVYKKKRDLFFKSKEFTFNVLKEKMLAEKKKEVRDFSLGKNESEFMKITNPPLELDINFNDLLNQDYVLVKYQVHNVFTKLRELSISTSKIPNFLVFSLIVNCKQLSSIKITYLKNVSNSDVDNNNILKINYMCPVFLNYIKGLESFSLINLPLLSTNIPSFVETLKSSKIKKLTINNCFSSKEDFNLIISFLSKNTLTELDLSNHYFHIPSLLSNTVLDMNLDSALTSLKFNNSELNEADIKIISNFVASSKTLRLLDIGNNLLSPLSCSTFGYCISKTNCLEDLRINECGINGENVLFILNGKGSKTLKHINLNANDVGDIGLVSISAFMRKTPEIESIELESCGGSDMGFASLVNMIENNNKCKIKYVNFHKNKITNVSLNLLKKFNDTFLKRKVVFALDKIEENNDNMDIDCAVFT